MKRARKLKKSRLESDLDKLVTTNVQSIGDGTMLLLNALIDQMSRQVSDRRVIVTGYPACNSEK